MREESTATADEMAVTMMAHNAWHHAMHMGPIPGLAGKIIAPLPDARVLRDTFGNAVGNVAVLAGE
jgi:hypothetical protein